MNQQNTKCVCGHTLDQHQRETPYCQYKHCPCAQFRAGFNFEPDYKTVENMAVQINALRGTLIVLQNQAQKLGLSVIAEELEFHNDGLANVVETLRTKPRHGSANL